MRKLMIHATVCLLLAGSAAVYAEGTATGSASMEAYRYTVPANSWFKAKIKPGLKAPPPKPAAGAETTSAPATTGDTPIAKSPEPPIALPFWKDIPVN